MLFKPRQKRQNISLQVYINEQEIEQVKETIFLGVFLDEYLYITCRWMRWAKRFEGEETELI